MAEFAEIRIDTDRLQRDTDIIKKHIGKFADCIDDVEKAACGEAELYEFGRAVSSELEALKEAVQGMLTLVTRLEDAKNSYTACENKIKDIIDAVRI